jgi:FMN phosphatase YigB (HAD superfamily)
MKKLILSLCLVPSLIWGKIFESARMEDLLPYATPETWVFIDADNTLFESTVHLGSSQWRDHIRKKAIAEGYTTKEAEEILDQFWLFVQPFIPVRSVDPKAPALIERLQKSNISVFVLTAREPIEQKHTQKQIDSIQVHLLSDLPEKFELPSPQPSLYENGVIYCGDNSKINVLTAFFQQVGKMPKKIIFVDDRGEQVRKVERGAEKLGIEFVGIRFSGADERVRSFDGQVADIQFCMLPKIMSDEEADNLLHFVNEKLESED